MREYGKDGNNGTDGKKIGKTLGISVCSVISVFSVFSHRCFDQLAYQGVVHVVRDDALKQPRLVGQVDNLPNQSWEE
jgi:hypothetical protein